MPVPDGVMVMVPGVMFRPSKHVGVRFGSRITVRVPVPAVMAPLVGCCYFNQFPPVVVLAAAVNEVLGPDSVRLCAAGTVPPV